MAVVYRLEPTSAGVVARRREQSTINHFARREGNVALDQQREQFCALYLVWKGAAVDDKTSEPVTVPSEERTKLRLLYTRLRPVSEMSPLRGVGAAGAGYAAAKKRRKKKDG